MLQLNNESTANTTKAHLDNTHDHDEAKSCSEDILATLWSDSRM